MIFYRDNECYCCESLKLSAEICLLLSCRTGGQHINQIQENYEQNIKSTVNWWAYMQMTTCHQIVRKKTPHLA